MPLIKHEGHFSFLLIELVIQWPLFHMTLDTK